MESIVEWALQVVEAFGYPGIFFLMFLENLFPPLPSEIILPLSGYVASRGALNPVLVVTAATVGSVMGTLVYYYVALLGGEGLVRRLIRKYGHWLGLKEESLEKTQEQFRKYGGLLVCFGRLVPGIRAWVSVPAGLSRMPPVQFLLYTVAGSIIWNSMLLYFGYILGANWTSVGLWLDERKTMIQLVAVFLIVAMIIYLVFRRRPGSEEQA